MQVLERRYPCGNVVVDVYDDGQAVADDLEAAPCRHRKDHSCPAGECHAVQTVVRADVVDGRLSPGGEI